MTRALCLAVVICIVAGLYHQAASALFAPVNAALAAASHTRGK
jgi:hypothetical protein